MKYLERFYPPADMKREAERNEILGGQKEKMQGFMETRKNVFLGQGRNGS